MRYSALVLAFAAIAAAAPVPEEQVATPPAGEAEVEANIKPIIHPIGLIGHGIAGAVGVGVDIARGVGERIGDRIVGVGERISDRIDDRLGRNDRDDDRDRDDRDRDDRDRDDRDRDDRSRNDREIVYVPVQNNPGYYNAPPPGYYNAPPPNYYNGPPPNYYNGPAPAYYNGPPPPVYNNRPYRA